MLHSLVTLASRKHNAKCDQWTDPEKMQMVVNLQTWSHDPDHAYFGEIQ